MILGLAYFQAPVTVPFEWLTAGAPIVTVTATINGHAGCRLSLDTGNAHPVAISAALAKQLSLPMREPVGGEHAVGVGGNNQIKLWDTDPVELGLGTATLTKVQANVSDYVDHLAQTLKVQLDGNIGYGLLKGYTVILDYPKKTLTLSNETLGVGTPFHLGKRPLMIVSTTVNGKGPYHFVLDTGAVRCVVSPELAESLKLPIVGKAKMLGGAGASEVQMAGGVSLTVSTHTENNLNVMVADFTHMMTKALSEPIDGVVGIDFFGKSKLSIDYPNLTFRID